LIYYQRKTGREKVILTLIRFAPRIKKKRSGVEISNSLTGEKEYRSNWEKGRNDTGHGIGKRRVSVDGSRGKKSAL